MIIVNEDIKIFLDKGRVSKKGIVILNSPLVLSLLADNSRPLPGNLCKRFD